MATLSIAARRQLQRVDDPDGFLMLLLIDSPALSGPVRVVQDTRDWLIDGTTYIGLPLSIQMPQDVAREHARAQIRIDNVGRDLIGEFERLPPGVSLDVTLRLVSRAAPAVTEWEFVSGGTKGAASVLDIALGIGDDEAMQRNAVALRCDPDTSPGIFAG